MIALGEILAGVLRRTEEGKLKWSKSVQGDRFITSVDAISIVIVEVNIGRYRLDILNESGETVDSLNRTDTSTEEDDAMAHLFVLARRSAFGTDATLEKLAKALEL